MCNKPIQQINKSATFHKILQLVVILLYTRFTTNRTRHRSEYKHVLANISRSRYVAIAIDATRAPIANPPNNAQLGGIPYHSPKLHPGPCNTVGMRPRRDRQTGRHTDARDHNTFGVVYDSREMLVHGQLKVTIISVVSVCLSVCLFVCLCIVFLSRLRSDLDQTRTHVTCPGLVVSATIEGLCDPWVLRDPQKLVFLWVWGRP